MDRNLKISNLITIITTGIGMAFSSILFSNGGRELLYLFENIAVFKNINQQIVNIILIADSLIMFTAFLILIATGRGIMLHTVANLKESMKEVMIRKIFGADNMDIQKLTIKDGIITVSLAFLISIFIVYFIHFSQLFPVIGLHDFSDTLYVIGILLIESLMTFFMAGIVPGIIYNKYSRQGFYQVVHVKSHQKWQLGILASQTFFSCLLTIMTIFTYLEYQYLSSSQEYLVIPIDNVAHFGFQIFLGCIASLLLTFTGKLSFLKKEIDRRTKEIAIRIICGSTYCQIIWLITSSIFFTIIPAYVIGALVGYFILVLPFSMFMPVISGGEILALCIILLAFVMLSGIIALYTYFITKGNLAKKLRDE